MTKVLVLGGSGRVGTMLRRSWRRGPLHMPTTFAYQTRSGAGLLWDMQNPPNDAVIAAGPFDVMVVLSGVVPRAGADFALNTSIGVAALHAAAQMGVGRVLLASTSAVYGLHSDAPFDEDAEPRPVNDYGKSKLEMELACIPLAETLGIELCLMRIGNVAGADALLLNAAVLQEGEALRLDQFPNGGTPLRSYIGPQTFAQVIGTLIHAEGALPQVLNIGAPEPLEMGALAQAAGVPVTMAAKADTGAQYITLNCNRLAVLHPFVPSDSTATAMVAQWQALRA
ncbi:NAD-dependent epimerase/dehydratase [Sulfitobacter sp. HNIBRBA2951]|uniref:NAD-dependent epimerase/dehydratase family protein n=1 Tax=Sulfitobacter aquimarinus TaxID=3158557 RepID=UPI0032E0196A